MNAENIITSKDNATLKLYKKLATSRKSRLEYNKFVLEGLRIIIDALNEESNITNIILTEQAYNKYYDTISQVDLKDAKLIVISNELGNKISQTEKTQGAFAICDMPKKKELALKKNGKYVVLNELQDPGNVGMIIRTADALGIDGIIMCDSCDIYSPKVIRSTMGSVFRVEIFIENDVENIFNSMALKKIATYAAVIDDDAVNINKIKFDDASAIFIGNEGNGLSKEVAENCDYKAIIPMNGNINSLNAAMAAGILMWELKRGACDA